MNTNLPFILCNVYYYMGSHNDMHESINKTQMLQILNKVDKKGNRQQYIWDGINIIRKTSTLPEIPLI